LGKGGKVKNMCGKKSRETSLYAEKKIPARK